MDEVANTDNQSVDEMEQIPGWESLTNSALEDQMAVHALKKERKRKQRKADFRHKAKDAKNRYYGMHDIPDDRKIPSSREAVEADLKEWNLEDEEKLNRKVDTGALIQKYNYLIDYLGEKTTTRPNLLEEYEGKPSIKDKLKYVKDLSIAEQIDLLASDNFTDEQLDYYLNGLDGLAMPPQNSYEHRWDRQNKGVEAKDLALTAIMFKTPEYSAYKGLEAELENGKYNQCDMPRLDLHENAYYYDDYYDDYFESSDYDSNVSKWYEIIDGYATVTKCVAKKYPELPKELFEHYAIAIAQAAFTKMAESSQSGENLKKCSFSEKTAWALLDSDDLRRKILQMTRKEYDYAKIDGIEDPVPLGYVGIWNIERFMGSDEKIGEKALDLQLAVGEADWVNVMPFDVIEHAYQAMEQGADVTKVLEKTRRELICKIVPHDTPPERIDQLVNDEKLDCACLCNLPALLQVNANIYKKMFTNGCGHFLNESMGFDDAMNVVRVVKAYGEDFTRKLFVKEPSCLKYAGRIVETFQHIKYELPDMEQIADLGIAGMETDGWLTSSIYDLSRQAILDYPLNGSERTKNSWCAKNAVVKFDSEFNNQTIGRIIFTRLNNRIERDIHDATFWLSRFKMPETGYDIERIKSDVATSNKHEDLSDYEMRLYDQHLEFELFRQIIHSDVSTRQNLRLPTKAQRMTQLFHNVALQRLFPILVEESYKDNSSKDIIERIKEKFKENPAYYLGYAESLKDHDLSFTQNNNSSQIEELFDNIGTAPDYFDFSPHCISETMQRLYQYGANRKKYANDASTWIERHMTAPNSLLTGAWDGRIEALFNGESDNASSIINYNTKLGISKTLELEPQLIQNTGLSPEEFMAKYLNYMEALSECRAGGSRAYSDKYIIKALAKYHHLFNQNKLMPAKSYETQSGDRKLIGTVLPYDSPRGMTIGFDTGCCMTIDGASESCIRDGYSNENAGFFVVDEPNGRIVAQSYFYVNPDAPEVVVMDNIEANSGRDPKLIIEAYEEFFHNYLLEQFRTNPEWTVREVHIGTGYGDFVKPAVLELPKAEVVLNHSGIYTDANKDQRLLVRLSDEEIEATRKHPNDGQAEVAAPAPTHHPFEYSGSLTINQAEVLQSLEEQLYPESMRQYKDADFLNSELEMPGASKYSFLINTQVDANHEPVGYCMAYEAMSESDPSFEGKCLYIADFGILSGYRSNNAALYGLEELLRRAKENNIGKIEMEARESTTYRLFSNPIVQRLLARRGYRVVDHGPSNDFGGGEATYLMSLEPIIEQEQSGAA